VALKSEVPSSGITSTRAAPRHCSEDLWCQRRDPSWLESERGNAREWGVGGSQGMSTRYYSSEFFGTEQEAEGRVCFCGDKK
jgi:hypothetical protein